MKLSEAESIGEGLSTKLQRILYGKWTAEDIESKVTDAPTVGFMWYWLGSTASSANSAPSTYLAYVDGSGNNNRVWHNYYLMSSYGVRPVIVVEKE